MQDSAVKGSVGLPKEGITGIVISAQGSLLLSSPEEALVNTRATSGCACGEDNENKFWSQIAQNLPQEFSLQLQLYRPGCVPAQLEGGWSFGQRLQGECAVWGWETQHRAACSVFYRSFLYPETILSRL